MGLLNHMKPLKAKQPIEKEWKKRLYSEVWFMRHRFFESGVRRCRHASVV